MAAFSRLQLAKALIEYDNEYLPTDLHRNAQQSAIFSSLRRNLPSRLAAHSQSRRSTDYLGVSIPGENPDNSSIASRNSTRKSLASIDALRNPFGRDSTHEGPLLDPEDDVEVDLSSWGLDALMDKKKKKGKEVRRQESDGKSYLPNPHAALPLQDTPGRRRPPTSARTMSMGNFPIMASQSRENLDDFGLGGAFLEAKSSAPHPESTSLGGRRHSVGSPLDYANVHPSDPALHRRRASEHALIDSIPITPPLHAVPFPTGRDPDIDVDDVGGLVYDEEPATRNSFALPPPTPDRASRFDPKVLDAQRQRVTSATSMGTRAFSPSPPPGSRPGSSMSGLMQQPGRDRLYSRLELMRPKVLIMPSPLQSAAPTSTGQPSRAREGFEFSTDGPPLPAGARTNARASTASLLSPDFNPGGQPGDEFIPNPRNTLTLSQLTFRNTLMVDGQRDVAFKDLELKHHMRWATNEGEQVPVDVQNESTPALPTMEITNADADDPRHKRAPGKLYGRSLIDDLEARKAEMKGKQRVFTGDQRPSMMARTPLKRSSTLIDPESLKQRPISTFVREDSAQTAPEAGAGGLARRKTLINFDDEIPGAPRGSFLAAGNNKGGGGEGGETRSVFGVDTLWERELAKLRDIEAREKTEEQERQKREAEEDGRKKKGKGKRKGRGRDKDNETKDLDTSLPGLSPSPSKVQDEANFAASPENPNAPKRIPRYPPPPPVDSYDDEDDEESDSSSLAGRPFGRPKTDGWHSGSDDGGEPRAQATGPRRTAGPGPKFADNLPPRFRALQEQQQLELEVDDEDSEEDVPLVATIGRAAQRATRADFSGARDDSSDEEKPLSVLIDKTKQKLPSPTSGSGFLDSFGTFGSMRVGDDDEDDKPLGLRVSRMGLSSTHTLSVAGGSVHQGEDDDRPLALHPDQLRRSQFVAAAQQQQMMMHAQAAAAAQMQMQQSMMFAPSIMSAPFYAPPMVQPMMMPAQLPTTPPPMHDAAKLNRVDKWRRDVAVEGEQ